MDNTEAAEKLADLFADTWNADYSMYDSTKAILAAIQADPWKYVKPKPLVWHTGSIGVGHEFAETEFGTYHVWGGGTWAGPFWQRGNEPNYTINGQNKAAVNESYWNRVKELF